VTISLAVTAIWVTLSIGRPGGNLSQRLARRTRGKGLAQIVEELSVYLTEWRGYFGFCETPSVLRDLDQWTTSCDAAASAGIWRREPLQPTSPLGA
jgi:Group II intron, maturase-specific domain